MWSLSVLPDCNERTSRDAALSVFTRGKKKGSHSITAAGSEARPRVIVSHVCIWGVMLLAVYLHVLARPLVRRLAGRSTFLPSRSLARGTGQHVWELPGLAPKQVQK